MSLSRWKIMAGVLGVSLGGLAAASQCPKGEGKRYAGRQAEPPALELPGIPTVASGGSAPKAPAAVPAPPAELLPPPLPIPTNTAEKPPAPPMPAMPMTSPAKPPMTSPVIPVGGTSDPAPALPLPVPGGVEAPKPAAPDVVPTKPMADVPPADPVVKPLGVPAGGTTPPAIPDTPPKPGNVSSSPPATAIEFSKPETKPEIRPEVKPAVAALPGKFRIMLQVGEGEPRFEVKYGDDLILKVVCEKVDIKSPEKGVGPSEVTARGKVRFVGFGSEGSCDELSFLAGTGEVQMTGKVRIAVKDKLGRVESELTTDTVKYKVDPTVILGSFRP